MEGLTPHVIAGVVTDEAGAPVEGAVLSLVAGPKPLPDIAALSAADGTFAVTAPVPGDYRLACRLPDGRSVEAEVSIDPEARQGATVELSP